MMGNQNQPIYILKEGTQRTKGRSAQNNNILAAKAVAEAVRSTLGPKGMDKMLVDSMGDVVITNDGATILKDSDVLADVTVRAVTAVAEKSTDGKWTVDKDAIKVEKKTGGSVQDTELVLGVVLDKERAHTRMPKTVKNAKVALLNAALEIKKTEVDANIEITEPSQFQAFLDEEEKTLRRFVDSVKASGANVLFTQKGIDDLAQHFLA